MIKSLYGVTGITTNRRKGNYKIENANNVA